MDPRQHVNPGDPIRLAATQVNGLNRLLATDTSLHASSGGEQRTPYTWVYAKPSTNVTRWSVLAITGIAIEPTSSADRATAQFESIPVVTVDTSSESTTACGVAVEPISSGKVGRIAVGGVVQCKTADLGKTFASTIIWKGSEWSLIRLNSGIVRAHFSGTWEKDSSKSVTAELLTGTTYTAHNYIATISSQTDCKCFIMHDGSEWVLVSWDLHKLPSYNAAKQQVLTHSADGGLAWVSTTNCS